MVAAPDSSKRSLHDAFGHGYLVTTDPALVPHLADAWERSTLGPLTVATQGRTRHGRHTTRDSTALVFGHPVDLEAGTTDLATICRRASRELARGGVEAFTRYVAYLTGRFTAYAVTPAEVVAVPDTCATQMTFWAVRAGHVVLGSHVELVAAAVDAEVNDEGIRRVKALSELHPKHTHFFAGIETAYTDVFPVIANCRARWSRHRAAMTHERFYPFSELAPTDDVEAVYGEWRDLFDQTCRHLASFGRTGVSLTAGLDSNTTLRGVLPHLGRDAFTFTYLNVLTKQRAHHEDAFVANRTAVRAGLPHRLLRWRRAAPGSLFDQVFGTTWKALRPSEGAARAMYEELPRGFFQLQSMHAEVGTVFYRDRSDAAPDARRLTTLYQGPRVAAEEEYVEQFERFIDYADFHPERLGNVNYHDLFYWEHRDSRWAAQKPHEGDLGHRVLQPFNNRRLLEVMHRLPFEARRDKVLLRRLEEVPLASLRRKPTRRERGLRAAGRLLRVKP